MESIAKIRLPTKPTTTLTRHPVEKHTITIDTTDKPLLNLNTLPRMLTVYAVYNTATHAFFLNRESPTNDWFYRALDDLAKQHKSVLNAEDIYYRLPHTIQGFRFKPAGKTNLRCVDRFGSYATSTQCEGKKVRMLLRVRPYDVLDEAGIRRIGLSIVVSEVMVLQ